MIKALRSCLLLAACSATLVVGAAAKTASVGQPAPDFTLADIDGKTHRLADYKGRVVVLEWINPECPFVQKHYGSGNIPSLQKSATADGAIWLTINSGVPGAQGDFDPAQIKSWLARHNGAPTAYFRDRDSAVGRLFDAKTTPHMFVIDAEGVLVYQGAIDSIRSANVADISRAENYVASALAAIKAGKPVAKSASEPYGCTVKY